jgi:protein-tyrosine phosphatase
VIDLHSHILWGVDDGASTVEDSLDMARMAVADGIEVMACTPHFMPGLYDNKAPDIRNRVAQLNDVFLQQGIDLALVTGGDAHMRPDFVEALQRGDILSLHDTRYVLFEPPHTNMPKRMDELVFNIAMAGYVPIVTHPERYKWIEQNYDMFTSLSDNGAWMQVTAGSLTGRFGKRAQYWAQRLLAEGRVNILATDAHNCRSRPPLLAEAFAFAAQEVGEEEATHLVVTRPMAVLDNADPQQVPLAPVVQSPPGRTRLSFWSRLFGG